MEGNPPNIYQSGPQFFNKDKDSLAGAPPPPSEVKVRTMRSDLASMAKSGGGIPKFQNVKVSGLSVERDAAASGGDKKSLLLTTVTVIIGLAAAGAIGYFAYTTFFAGGSKTPTSPTAAPSTTPNFTPTPTPVTPVSASTSASSTQTLTLPPIGTTTASTTASSTPTTKTSSTSASSTPGH